MCDRGDVPVTRESCGAKIGRGSDAAPDFLRGTMLSQERADLQLGPEADSARSSEVTLMTGGFAASVLAILAAGPNTGTEPFQSITFELACKSAGEAKKVVLIDFYTTWCGPCKMLDRQTWTDPDVRKWLAKNTLALKIDAEKEVDLAKKYKIQGYPTILFLKPDGTEIDRIVGFRPPDQFLEEARGALGGKDAVARAKEKLEAGHKNDPMQRVQYARALQQKGKLKEALDEYLWCFDHGREHSMGFAGVRLSFLLSDISQLGRSYPPALDALRERRDTAEKAVLNPKRKKSKTGFMGMFPGGDGPTEFAMDLAALNRTLGENERTLAVFDKLAGQKDAETMRRIMLRDVIDELLAAKRYDDILSAIGDATSEVDRQIRSAEASLAYLKTTQRPAGEDFTSIHKSFTVKECGKYYEAALGAKKPKQAATVADRILKFDESEATFVLLAQHALDTDDLAAARTIVARGEKSLDDEHKSELRRIAARISAAQGDAESESE